MKEGAVSIHLQLVHSKKDVQPKENVERQDTAIAPWMSQASPVERSSVETRGSRSMSHEQESRDARIEALRARVHAGTYRVESMVLAESMMKNESHFRSAAL